MLVWDPGVALYLVDPVTGKATQVRTASTDASGGSSGKPATTPHLGETTYDFPAQSLGHWGSRVEAHVLHADDFLAPCSLTVYQMVTLAAGRCSS